MTLVYEAAQEIVSAAADKDVHVIAYDVSNHREA